MRPASKEKIRRAFDKSADSYDRYAGFQNEIANEVADEIARLGFSGVALDIGCGAGLLAERLGDMGVFKTIIGADISEAMVRKSSERLAKFPAIVIQADAEQLPVADGTFDLVASTLSLQWVDGLGTCFRQAATALKPGGRFIGATLGESTFAELREALGSIYGGGGDGVFHSFISASKLEEIIESAGLKVSVRSSVRKRKYESFHKFLKNLKKVGAQNSGGLSGLGLGRRKVMKDFADEYHSRFAMNGGVYATYEVLFFDAVKVEEQAR